MRRRLLPACLALLVLTGLFLVFPVLSAPGAQPVAVKAVAAEVPMTGAHQVIGAIGALWAAAGAEHGLLGYPTQSVSWAADHLGQYAKFEHGSIYWTPSTGAWEVRGLFLNAWVAVGTERGVLGYPIGEPYAVNGGQWQKFQHGYVAYSTALGRSWAVHQ